jgi:hypothetical protein
MNRRASLGQFLLVGLAGFAIALVSGCQESEPSEVAATSPGAESGAGSGSARAFLSLFRSDLVDYDVAATPEQLATGAALVVEGHVTSIVEGRSFTIGEGDASQGIDETAVMHVAVDKVLVGELPKGSDNAVYVEFFGIEEPKVYDAAVPSDLPVLFFLTPSPEDLVPGSTVVNPNAGYPEGQPLFSRVSPQGFYVQDGADVVQVTDHVMYPDAELEDFYPDRSSFPEDQAVE